jgi:hypothetical protein
MNKGPSDRYARTAKKRRRGAQEAPACCRACRYTLLNAFRKSSCRVTSLGQRDRPRAWPTLWLHPGLPTPSCRGASARPASRQAAITQTLARRTHTPPTAIGRTTRRPGFARAMRAEACVTSVFDMQVKMRASTHVHVVTAVPEQVSPAARSSVTECFAALTFETCSSVPFAELEISGAPTLSLAPVSTLCTQAVNSTIEQQAPCDRSSSEAITLASTVTTLEAVMLDLNASFAQIDELVGVWFTYSDTDSVSSKLLA